MDKIKAINEVIELRKLSEHYTELLKSVQIDLNTLPDDCLAKLNKYADYKKELKLFDFDLSYLEEHIYTKELEDIENDELIAQLKNDIQELEEDIVRENADVDDIKKVSHEFSKTVTSLAETTKAEDDFKMEEKILLKKINQFTVPQEINIDDLIAKIQKIKMMKTTSK